MFKFIKSAENKDQYINDNKPEVCFIGRSNVGKSSLINALSNSKIAKTSSTPGRTQLVNFFDCNSFRLVDLPGYGFAKLDKKQINAINEVIKQYFEYSKNLKLIVHLCDANVIMEQDIEFSNYLRTINKKYLLVLNKVDKEKMYRYQNQLKKYQEIFNISQDEIIFVSAKTNFNISNLFNLINKLIKE